MNTTLMLTVFVVGAPALKDAPKKESSIVGEWAVQSISVGGTAGQPHADRWEFKADGTFAIYSSGKTLESSRYVSDAKVTLPTLDILPAAAGSTEHLCNFRIDGDTLTLSVGHDKVRPGRLEPGERTTVWLMTRIKK